MPFSSHNALEEKDLAFLRRILEEMCSERHLVLNSDEAREISRSLINWYGFGVRHPEQLKSMIDPWIETPVKPCTGQPQI